MCFIAKKDLVDRLPGESFEMLVVGGVLYTIGAFFYLKKQMKYHHAIWHILVLMAATAHFLAVYKTY